MKVALRWTSPSRVMHRSSRNCASCVIRMTLTALATTPGGHALAERPDDMTFEAGGGGRWSTPGDYLSFARLFTGNGAVDGVRILRPETCRMMASNQLTSQQRATTRMFNQRVFAEGTDTEWGWVSCWTPKRRQQDGV